MLFRSFRSNDRLRLAGPVHLRRNRHKKDEALAKARQAACGKACGGAKAQLRQARTDLECASVVEVPSTDHCLCELMIRGMVPKRAVTITLNVHNITRILAEGQPEKPVLQKSETMLVPNLRNQ